MLNRAHGLAVARLRKNNRDTDALHVIARVELAMSRPQESVVAAKLAATSTAGPARGAAFATLSRAYLALGEDGPAHRSARLSIKAGCSIGWDTLAELLYRPTDDPGGDGDAGRYRQYVEAKSRVTAEDRQAYHGLHRGSADIARTVLQRQSAKLKHQAAQIKSRTDSIKSREKASEPNAHRRTR
jgi:hypothetical protein